jgi:hypothetical protein
VKIGMGTFLKNGVTKESIESGFRRVTAAISAGFAREHRDDGTHTDVTTTSVTVGTDPSDGTWNGNVGGSLVPTSSTQDLGATITQGANLVGDHPWRNLRISGTITWTDYSTGTTTTSRPVLTRTGNNLALASEGTVVFDLTNGANTHTLTIGRGLSGMTTNRNVACASLSITGGGGLDTYLSITDGVTAPGGSVGLARIYVDTADGDLKVVFGDGTVKLIVAD